MIESVAKVADKESLKIDTRELREQGADLKRRMEQIMRSVQDQQHQQGQAQAARTKHGWRRGHHVWLMNVILVIDY